MKTETGVKYETVPLPHRGSSGFAAALRECPVGKSFLFKFPNGTGGITHQAKNMGAKVTVRRQEKGVYRIWRIA